MRVREIELWQQALALLNDEIYLDLIRNFLGKVPTPYHKPLLNKEMTTLFSSEEFVTRVESSLSPLDKKILTSVYLLESPTQSELCALFEDSFDYVTLQQNVANLEERLLLVPNPRSQIKGGELMLNPLLKSRFMQNALSIEALFLPPSEGEKGLHFGNGQNSLIRGLLSLHFHEYVATKERSEKILRSKLIKTIFSEDVEELIVNYNRLLFFTQAVKDHNKASVVNHKQAFALLAMSAEEIQHLLFLSTWYSKESLNTKVIAKATLSAFFQSLNEIIANCTLVNNEQLLLACRLAALKHHLEVTDWDELLALLSAIGLSSKENLWGDGQKGQHLKATIDSDLTLSFSHDQVLNDGKVDLYMLAVIKKFDVVNSYELNKKTLLRAFDGELSTKMILDYLKQLTGSIPQTLEDLLGQWKQEYSAITIYDGLIIKVDERLSRIIEALPALKPYLIATIAKGIYLFSREEESAWREILSSTGIGLLPSSIGRTEMAGEVILKPFVPTESARISFSDALKNLPRQQPPTEPFDEFKGSLLALARKKGSSKAEREELEARIEQKLILLPSQVVNIERFSKTMEASGFDFQGKVNLCKTTLNSPLDLLELHLLDEEGNSRTLLGEVKEIISGSSIKETAVRVALLPEKEEKVIPIAKVFRVRKLRRSIFFQG
ncbi:MAG: hypothetical protein WC224_06145 [Sphaerochaetaceae bacterium]